MFIAVRRSKPYRTVGAFAAGSLPALLTAVLISFLCVGCTSDAPPRTDSAGKDQPSIDENASQADASIENVRLKINIPDGQPIDLEINHRKDATVLSIMESAQDVGALEFEYRGSGESAFVFSIAGTKNAGGSGKNWIYLVNENLGDCSAGIKTVKPGDVILWSYGKPNFDELQSKDDANAKN